jgi:hypothetical protein
LPESEKSPVNDTDAPITKALPDAPPLGPVAEPPPLEAQPATSATAATAVAPARICHKRLWSVIENPS